MSEKFNNRCDTECPRNAILQAIARKNAADAPNRWERGKAKAAGLAESLGHLTLAVGCPNGDLKGDLYKPTTICDNDVKKRLESADQTRFTEWEHRLLDPYYEATASSPEAPQPDA